jgi:hypothetical protein
MDDMERGITDSDESKWQENYRGHGEDEYILVLAHTDCSEIGAS